MPRANWPALIITFAFLFVALPLVGQQPGTTLEEAVPASANYATAEFRLWSPNATQILKAALILVPGFNADGRAMADDIGWRAFAVKHGLALVGCRFVDKDHEQNFIEEYVEASRGSGQALLEVLQVFAARSGHPELAQAPLLLWGMSAGGAFNYEFVAWKPERVIAFVVNKSGLYYTALVSQAARNVPGILFVGGKDLSYRRDAITGLFAVNRRAAALWALAEEPDAAHVVGRSIEVTKVFFEDVLALRLVGDPLVLKAIPAREGFVGDPKTKAIHPVSAWQPGPYPFVWFPTERVARAWYAMATNKPIDP